MKCPNCKVKLGRARYEDVVIHACEKCSGSLVNYDRLKVIENRRDKSREDLMNELAGAATDTKEKIRCAGCFSTMEKRTKKIGTSNFTIDRCDKCKLVWLDAGELAKLQVIYECSDKGEESLKFQQRLANMTPDEKAELDRRIANLPNPDTAVDLVTDVLNEMGRRRIGGGYLDFLDLF